LAPTIERRRVTCPHPAGVTARTAITPRG